MLHEISEQLNVSEHEKISQVLSSLQLSTALSAINLSDFAKRDEFGKRSLDERLAAAFYVFFELISQSGKHKVFDRYVIDKFIVQLDQKLSKQIDEIIHHPSLQQLESSWRGLHYLAQRIPTHSNVKLDIINISKQSLSENFSECDEIKQSLLYKRVYIDEYDTPGGEPYGVILGDYYFDNSDEDIELLGNMALIAQSAHCPFIAATHTRFFQKNSMAEVAEINNIAMHFEKADYIHWNIFRERPETRYLGLTFPRMLLRKPYNNGNEKLAFNYQEQTLKHQHYLWGNAAFALVSNLASSFSQDGWAVNIRGIDSGGRVADLPLVACDYFPTTDFKPPLEIILSESQELQFSEFGFIPLSYFKNTNYGCFFSANSVQKPVVYTNADATANSRLNARLPYVLLISRIAHYLKVLQRENIGTSLSKAELSKALNEWLNSLVTKMSHPGPEIIARHPLRSGHVEVFEQPDNPGYFQIQLYVTPHFQVEGMDIRLSLVGQLPHHSARQSH